MGIVPDAAEIHAMVVAALDKVGYRPHGHDGSAWEHPNGTRVTTGYTGGQLRLRRFVPGNDRFNRIPPVIWDVKGTPDEADLAMFVGGERPPAPNLTAEELAILERFEEADDAPESFRDRLIEALGRGLKLGEDEIQLADSVLEVIRGEQ